MKRIVPIVFVAMLLCMLVAFCLPFFKVVFSKDKSITTIQPTVMASFAGNDETIAGVPDDGQAHIIYKSNNDVVKCKIIHISNDYTTHIVWIESLPTGLNNGGSIRDLSTH